jgi:hypothetical protein
VVEKRREEEEEAEAEEPRAGEGTGLIIHNRHFSFSKRGKCS